MLFLVIVIAIVGYFFGIIPAMLLTIIFVLIGIINQLSAARRAREIEEDNRRHREWMKSRS